MNITRYINKLPRTLFNVPRRFKHVSKNRIKRFIPKETVLNPPIMDIKPNHVNTIQPVVNTIQPVINNEDVVSTLNKSHVLPYTIGVSSIGLMLSIVVANPVPFFIAIPLGACAGMIRNKNFNRKHDNYITAGIKIVTIYVMGPSLLMVGCGLIILVCVKLV
jgi:hypothetical protein